MILLFSGICFPTETELYEKNEYERVAFPKTIQEMMAINEQQKKEAREKIVARETEIAKNLLKLGDWKKDIRKRRSKKETVRILNQSCVTYNNLIYF